MSFTDQANFMCKMGRKKSARAKAALVCWVEAIYAIWLLRNSHVFKGYHRSYSSVSKDVYFHALCRLDIASQNLLLGVC